MPPARIIHKSGRHAVFAWLAISLLGACADYRFAVNERVVYSPEPLFTDYNIEDPALRDCIDHAIRDHGITAAGQLQQLSCIHAGISSLNGLGTFAGIAYLELTGNSITDLGPLAPMTRLTELELEANKVGSLLPLRGLEALHWIGVRGNSTLDCEELGHFQTLPNVTVAAPKHCD